MTTWTSEVSNKAGSNPLDELTSLHSTGWSRADRLATFSLKIAKDALRRHERVVEATLCRSLDAIHIAAAQRAGEHTTLLTFDIRQAQAARSVGMSVVGV